MLKYLVIIAVVIVVAYAAFTYRTPEKRYENTNITFQGYNPETFGDCKDTCKASCPNYGWIYSGYRYEFTDKECICFCQKEI